MDLGRAPRWSRGALVAVAAVLAVAGVVLASLPLHTRVGLDGRRVDCGTTLGSYVRDDPGKILDALARGGERQGIRPPPAPDLDEIPPAFARLLERVSTYDACSAAAQRRLLAAEALLFLAGVAVVAAFALRAGGRAPFGAAVALIAWAGLAVRAFYVGTISRKFDLGFDAGVYALGWDTYHASALFPPAWSAVVGAASAVGLDTQLEKMFVGSVVGSGTIVLVGFLGRRVGGTAVGLLAAALAAASPFLIASDGSLMSESLYVALVVAAVLAVVSARARPTLVRWAVVGVLVGLAVLTRGEALLLLPLLVVPMVVRSDPHARRRLVLGAAAVAATAAVVVPWSVRNTVAFDEFTPLSNNSSTVIAGANCDGTYSGQAKGFWVIECLVGRYTRAEMEGRGFDETRTNNRVRDDGLRYARGHLSELPGVAAVRVLRTWGLYEPTWQMEQESIIEVRAIGLLHTGWWANLALCPLAVYGAVALHRRRVELWPLLSLVVMVTVTSALTYGIQRFRLAAEPAVLILAAAGLVALLTRLGRLRRTAPPGSASSASPRSPTPGPVAVGPTGSG